MENGKGLARADWVLCEPTFDSRLKDVLHRVRQNLGDQMDRMGEDMVEIGKGLCPVETGKLRDSIELKDRVSKTGKIRTRVVTGTKYGAHVEFGTQNVVPQPFLVPARSIARRNFNTRVSREGLVG